MTPQHLEHLIHTHLLSTVPVRRPVTNGDILKITRQLARKIEEALSPSSSAPTHE